MKRGVRRELPELLDRGVRGGFLGLVKRGVQGFFRVGGSEKFLPPLSQ